MYFSFYSFFSPCLRVKRKSNSSSNSCLGLRGRGVVAVSTCCSFALWDPTISKCVHLMVIRFYFQTLLYSMIIVSLLILFFFLLCAELTNKFHSVVNDILYDCSYYRKMLWISRCRRRKNYHKKIYWLT